MQDDLMMKKITKVSGSIIPVAIIITLLITSAFASVGYELMWFTIDGGGGTFTSGEDYTLVGSVGQHDTGIMGDCNISIKGGFWGYAGLNYCILLPLIQR